MLLTWLEPHVSGTVPAPRVLDSSQQKLAVDARSVVSASTEGHLCGAESATRVESEEEKTAMLATTIITPTAAKTGNAILCLVFGPVLSTFSMIGDVRAKRSWSCNAVETRTFADSPFGALSPKWHFRFPTECLRVDGRIHV